MTKKEYAVEKIIAKLEAAKRLVCALGQNIKDEWWNAEAEAFSDEVDTVIEEYQNLD